MQHETGGNPKAKPVFYLKPQNHWEIESQESEQVSHALFFLYK